MRRLISSHNSVATPFRSTDKEDHKHYLTLSSDKLERDGILISPLSILRMRVEKVGGVMVRLEVRVEDSEQPTSWCMEPEGDGYQVDIRDWSEESLHMLEITALNTAPPRSGAPGVKMEHRESHLHDCLSGVHQTERISNCSRGR